MAKYDTGKDTSRQLDERVVAEWTEMPFTSHDKRSWTVQHRVVAESFAGTGVDVRHEVRSDEADGVPDDWTSAEVYEAREHGVSKITRADGEEWWS
jgi:hypothetical protein